MTRSGNHETAWLAAYLDGQLDSAASARVAEHVLACRQCRDACESIRFSSSAVRSLPKVAAPYGTFERIESALDGNVAPVANLTPAADTGFSTAWAWGAVAVLDLFVFGLIAWSFASAPPTAFQVTALEGTPIVGQRMLGKGGMIGTGEWLETDAGSRARIAVADIGQVEIGPNSRIGLVTTSPQEHRLSLEHGSMRAVVMAPPRLFLVDTPTATAVDYGCVYTLEVSDDSRSTLRVSSGRVALERNGRDVMVPEGAMCEARKGIGVGTPYYEDATEALRDAVRRFDFEAGGAAALATILAEARPRDALTLEALVNRVADADRSLIQNRLDLLVQK